MKDSQHQPHFSMAVVKDITFIWFPSSNTTGRRLVYWQLNGRTAAPGYGWWRCLPKIPIPVIYYQILPNHIWNHRNLYTYKNLYDGSWWIMIPFNSMGSIWCLNLRHIIECPNIETLHQSLLTQIHKTLALLPANLRERSLPGFEEEGRSVLGRNGEGSGRLENVIICVTSFQRSWRMIIQSCRGT